MTTDNTHIRYILDMAFAMANLTHWGRDKMDAVSQTTFSSAFFNENVWIPIKISLKFVPRGPSSNIPALVRIMAWRRQATSHYLKQWRLICWRIYASLGLSELNNKSVCYSYARIWKYIRLPYQVYGCTRYSVYEFNHLTLNIAL